MRYGEGGGGEGRRATGRMSADFIVIVTVNLHSWYSFTTHYQYHKIVGLTLTLYMRYLSLTIESILFQDLSIRSMTIDDNRGQSI